MSNSPSRSKGMNDGIFGWNTKQNKMLKTTLGLKDEINSDTVSTEFNYLSTRRIELKDRSNDSQKQKHINGTATETSQSEIAEKGVMVINQSIQVMDDFPVFPMSINTKEISNKKDRSN